MQHQPDFGWCSLAHCGAPSLRCTIGGWETTGHGITHPRRWPAAPLESIPPPAAKRMGHQGGISDGPSVRRTRYTGVRPPCKRCRIGSAARLPTAYQPALPPPGPPVEYDTTNTINARANIVRSPPLHWFRFAAIGADCLGSIRLPAGLAARSVSEGEEDRDQNESFHVSPHVF